MGMKQQFYSSILSGETYTSEILNAINPRVVPTSIRLDRAVFNKLCKELRDRKLLADTRKKISVEQQVHIFLYIISNSATNRRIQDRFQHSGETITRHFSSVLDALEVLSLDYITLPIPGRTLTPLEITRNPKFYPYFKDCIGALDGSLIPARVSKKNSAQAAYRCRKGFLAQNILAVISFDFTFQYVLAGWEGSVNDSRVLEDALSEQGFTIPANKYYLADAGYGLTVNILTPYRGVRYHLKEYGQGTQKLQNAKELFNLRHASLRSVIERVFGVLKKRFPILKIQSEYSIEKQVKLIKALCCLHNYIIQQGDNTSLEILLQENESVGENGVNRQDYISSYGVATIFREEKSEAKLMRDGIAERTWRDYKNYTGNDI